MPIGKLTRLSQPIIMKVDSIQEIASGGDLGYYDANFHYP